MIRDVILPQLAMGMSKGTVVEWTVTEGSSVKRDETIVSIETEKVVTDLPAPYGGFLHIVRKAGDTLAVEEIIARIADTEAEYRSLVAGDGTAAAPVAAASAQIVSGPMPAAPGPVSTAGSPSASASAHGEGNGAAGRLAAAEFARRIKVSGLAKAIARQHSLDLSSVVGTGPGGRIVRRDVAAALEARDRAAPASSPSLSLSPSPSPSPSRQVAAATGSMRERARIPLAGMRGTIAARMVAAKTTAAQTYGFFEVDITKLLALRQSMLSMEESIGQRIALISFYVKAVALACQHVPICNATLTDDEITVWENVNVGVAVALPGRTEFESGLIVPVVRDVQSKGLARINAEIKDLIDRARKGELRPDETSGGTITISSTDGFLPGGWLVSTPLLNLPQVMNVQPGTPIEKPVVVDGHIVIRTILPFGSTFDHRAMDGVPSGRFTTRLRDLLANPELMLL